MSIHRPYQNLNPEDRKIFIAWLKWVSALWTSVVIVILSVGLALKAPTVTTAQIAMPEQSAASR